MPQYRQFAALPYRLVDDTVEVLLITSRESRRWIIPKGWAKASKTPHALARLEAREEAGVEGSISPIPIGTYFYTKRLHFFARARCEVQVFALRVESESDAWPEQSERIRRWMTKGEAAGLVAEEGLADLIRSFAPTAPEPSAGA